jgi:hypothetical protein
MPKLRILVLTSSTGGGHDARAEAFAEWCFQLYRHDVDVRIEQMLEKSSIFHRSGVGTYNYIQRSVPWLHNLFYAIVELLSYINQRSVVFGAHYYKRVLRDYKPHLVFSVHDCLNRGYFQSARRILGADRVRCATYCGEFSGGWGYSRNWIEPSADLYVSRTPTARDYAVKCGIPADRTSVRGYLMRPRAHLESLAVAAAAPTPSPPPAPALTPGSPAPPSATPPMAATSAWISRRTRAAPIQVPPSTAGPVSGGEAARAGGPGCAGGVARPFGDGVKSCRGGRRGAAG